MDIENLSKTDLILTAVFLSFVTAVVTGIVVIFLMEDTPKEIVRDRIIPSEATTTASADAENSAATTTDEAAVDDQPRDEILRAAVAAVARITADQTSPQAGVLVELSGRDVVVTAPGDFSVAAQALFEDGTVADLGTDIGPRESSVLPVTATSDEIYPLQTTDSLPAAGDSAFVVPLSAQPEIIRVSVSGTDSNSIQTSASSLPATSLLFTNSGRLVGLFRTETADFRLVSQIELDE